MLALQRAAARACVVGRHLQVARALSAALGGQRFTLRVRTPDASISRRELTRTMASGLESSEPKHTNRLAKEQSPCE